MTTPETAHAAFGDADYRDQAAFRQALSGFQAFAERQARQVGITTQQYLLLLTIRGHPTYPQVTVGAVAVSLQRDPSSASTLVEGAVRAGLMCRRADPTDRRRALLSLSERGQSLLDTVMTANRRAMVELALALARIPLQRPVSPDDAPQPGALENGPPTPPTV